MVEVLYAVFVIGALLVGQALLRDFRTLAPTSSVDRVRPAVCAVVPARNEEGSLPALLRSLTGLRRPIDVIVVDDESTDGTSAVAHNAGALVVHPGHPPSGWTGKAWACHVGAHSTETELLLFLDADTTLAPDALDRLLDLHDSSGGLISVQPFHQVQRPYEHLSAYFNAIAVMASAVFAGGMGQRPMAFGPCLLTSRDDYERAGGHTTVRAEILDDVSLAAAYRRTGLPVQCVAGGSSLRMRSYPNGIQQLVSGWSKNIASGAAATAPRAGLASALWLGAHHLIAVNTVVAVWRFANGQPDALLPLAVWTVAWVATALQVRSVLRRVGSFAWWTWALFPLPLVMFDIVFAISAVNTVLRRSVRWRGRVVRTAS